MAGVEISSRRMCIEMASSRKVSRWFLALPVDPTNENLEWFSAFTADQPFDCMSD